MQVEGQFNLTAQEVSKLNKEGQVNAFNLLGADSATGLPYDERVSLGANDLEDICNRIAKDRFPNPNADWELVLFAIVETVLARYDLGG